MAAACHICEIESGEDESEFFTCGDCGAVTCQDCKSFGVARDDDYCQRCRG